MMHRAGIDGKTACGMAKVLAKTRAVLVLTTFFAAVLLATPPVLRPGTAQDQTADPVLQWNAMALDMIRKNKSAPGSAVRTLAFMHAAMFDAANAILQTHLPYRFSVAAAPGASAEAAAVQAACVVLRDHYTKNIDELEAVRREALAHIPAGPGQEEGVRVGDTIARQLLDARRHDGLDARQPYTPDKAPGKWQPVPPDFAQASAPRLELIRPFVMTSPAQFRVANMPGLESAEYVNELTYIRNIGAKHSTVRTEEQGIIARFWLDGASTFTPPGHWNAIAVELARQRGQSWSDNLRLLALLNLALGDANIIDADQKYTFHRWRPITAIRQADTDNNPHTAPVPDWESLLPTPATPAYVSGHSTFAGAADAVLSQWFGHNVPLTVAADPQANLPPRHFGSITQAADEAGMSRVYGGVHWPSDNRDGLLAGRQLGQYVMQNLLRPRG